MLKYIFNSGWAILREQINMGLDMKSCKLLKWKSFQFLTSSCYTVKVQKRLCPFKRILDYPKTWPHIILIWKQVNYMLQISNQVISLLKVPKRIKSKPSSRGNFGMFPFFKKWAGWNITFKSPGKCLDLRKDWVGVGEGSGCWVKIDINLCY